MIRFRREELKALSVERCCQTLSVCRSEYYAHLRKSAEPKSFLEFDALVSEAADERGGRARSGGLA